MGIVARNVGKRIGDTETQVLSDITLEIRDGEFIALTGRSGSGKSTLLYLLSTLDSVSSGDISFDGVRVDQLKQDALSLIRNERIGFVFQFHYLLAELSALENVLMPARKYNQLEKHTEHAKKLLDQFGLGDKLHRLPRQLSGGEQQRVAIARALSMKPKYLFADEPTGSLDSVNSDTVMKIIRESNRELGTTIIMVTHDSGYAKLAHRQIQLVDGRIFV